MIQLGLRERAFCRRYNPIILQIQQAIVQLEMMNRPDDLIAIGRQFEAAIREDLQTRLARVTK